MTRLIRNIKQLFPLWYWSKHESYGNTYVVVWKMWFGKVYKRRVFYILEERETY